MKYRLRLASERDSYHAVQLVDSFVRSWPLTTLCQGALPASNPLRLMQSIARLEAELAGPKVASCLSAVPAELTDEAGKVHTELLRVVRRCGRLATSLEPAPLPPPDAAKRAAERAAKQAEDERHAAIGRGEGGDPEFADLRRRGQRR